MSGTRLCSPLQSASAGLVTTCRRSQSLPPPPRAPSSRRPRVGDGPSPLDRRPDPWQGSRDTGGSYCLPLPHRRTAPRPPHGGAPATTGTGGTCEERPASTRARLPSSPGNRPGTLGGPNYSACQLLTRGAPEETGERRRASERPSPSTPVSLGTHPHRRRTQTSGARRSWALRSRGVGAHAPAAPGSVVGSRRGGVGATSGPEKRVQLSSRPSLS